jgi:hypothetical protein
MAEFAHVRGDHRTMPVDVWPRRHEMRQDTERIRVMHALLERTPGTDYDGAKDYLQQKQDNIETQRSDERLAPSGDVVLGKSTRLREQQAYRSRQLAVYMKKFVRQLFEQEMLEFKVFRRGKLLAACSAIATLPVRSTTRAF